MMKRFMASVPLKIPERLFLIKVIFPYVGGLAALLIGGLIGHGVALAIVEEETIRNNTARIIQSAEQLETRLEEIDSMVEQLELNLFVQRFQRVEIPFQGATTFQVISTLKNLDNHKLWNSSLVTYYILFHRSRYVLEPDAVHTFQDFAEHIMMISGGESAAWLRSVASGGQARRILPVRTISHSDRKRKAALYVRPLGHPSNSQATVIVAVDGNLIGELLDQVRDGPDNWAYLIDRDETIIDSVGGDRQIPPISQLRLKGASGSEIMSSSSGKLFITHARLDRLGLVVIAGQSYAKVMEKVSRVRSITLAITGAMGIIGILAVLLFAYRSSGPLNLLLRLFANPSEPVPVRDPYGFIGDRIKSLMSDRDSLMLAVREQEPIVRAAFTEQLLSGRIRDRNECAIIAKRLGIRDARFFFLTASISIGDRGKSLTQDSLADLMELKSILRQALGQCFHHPPLIFDSSQTSMALLLTFDNAESGQVRKLVENQIGALIAHLPGENKDHIRIGFGSFRDDPFTLAESYSHAGAALFRISSSEQYAWYDDSPNAEKYIHYSMGMESQLKNAIQLGDEDSAKTILDDLFRENIDNRKLDAAMRSILLFDVVSTTVKALDEIHCARDEVQETIASIMERRDSCDRSMDAEDIAELVLMACRSCRNRTTDHTGKLLEEMVQFIDCHISDPNLSLQGAAASLSISEVHLSRVFSSRMGRPFREYIEESRMCRAKEMLQTTQLPIKEIAFAVGYRSMNTFSRAFSRKNGSTASSFRS